MIVATQRELVNLETKASGVSKGIFVAVGGGAEQWVKGKMVFAAKNNKKKKRKKEKKNNNKKTTTSTADGQ